MYLNLRINFKFSFIVFVFLISVNFISAQDFFQIKNGLQIDGFGSFESNLPENNKVTGNLTIIRKDNQIQEYKLELLEGEKFIPINKYVNSIFGIVDFRTLVFVSLFENGEKAIITGDGSINLPSIKGYIIKGSKMNITVKNGIFSKIDSLEIDGDSSFDFNGINLYIPQGIIFIDVKIINSVVKSFTLKNKLDKDLEGINVGKISDTRIKQGNENYVNVKITENGYELSGKGSNIGELYELKEDQVLFADSSGKISIPAVSENTITLRTSDREVIINKLETDIKGVKEIKPFARGNVEIVAPGKSIKDIEGAAVQFGADKDNKLNLVLKDFSSANILGYGKIENGKPYPERVSLDVGTTVFVNRIIFYNGNRKIEQVYEGSGWKEMNTGKVTKTRLSSIPDENNVKEVLGLLGENIGNGAFLRYKRA